MNILVINGSPKGEKSNTMNLTRAFLDGAGYANADVVNVSKSDIKACTGCYACWSKTPGKCIFNDDMDEILRKFITADVVIWSFPLYCYNVPGGLKNLIDRRLPLSLPFMSDAKESGSHPPRYDLTHQRHVIISTCGFWTPKGNYNSIIPMFDHIFGIGNYTTIFCGQGELFRIPEMKNSTDEYLETVRVAGKEFSFGTISAETQTALEEQFLPKNIFEKMADLSWGLPTYDDKEENTPTDDSLIFTKQMAALYVPDGNERVLEMHYTDIGKTYQILLTTQGSEVITDGFRKYTTKIETPYSVWRAISRGEISGQDALFQQQYKVLGDFDTIMRWDELFGGAKPKKKAEAISKSKPQRKTNMKILLMPWIVIWIAIAINPTIGGALGIISAALVPLLWLKYNSVVYEQITIPVVAGLSLAVLLGVDARIVVSASYLCFGLMWTISAFTSIPLTANYSYNDHGGKEMLQNPLFMRINCILTVCWGCLYIVLTILVYIVMGTALLPYTGLISSAAPALMGIFTAWYPRWYMAKWARG